MNRIQPIGLQEVMSYGTEGRRKDGPQVPPSDKIYEFILFRGNDITDLHVKSPAASAKAEEQIYSDPAIIQSQYSRMPLSSSLASVGSRNFTESTQWLDTPAMTSRAFPVGLPSHQSMTQLSPSDSSAATQVAGQPSFPPPMCWQGNGVSSSRVHSVQQSSHLQPPSTVSHSLMQNQVHTPETVAPTKVSCATLEESGIPASSATASSLVNLNPSPSHSSLQIPDFMDIPSLLPTKTPMPYSASITSNVSNIALEGQTSVEISPDMRPTFPGHSVHRSTPFVNSTSGPKISSPPLLTADQFAEPGQHFFFATQNLTPDRKGTGTLTPTSFSTSVLVPSQEPLPTSMQKPRNSATQFTEEFDFKAMNEKFKKDKVWGSLGKATENIEGAKGECHGPMPNPKHAYKKDDFFDTISCNSLTQSRTGQYHLSERMKPVTEAFANFQQRPNIGYGADEAGRGDYYQGSYNLGGGYSHGGRGRGGQQPF